MDSELYQRFEFGDPEGVVAYWSRMLRWREQAEDGDPLSPGLTYTIKLQAPTASSCARPLSTRPLPALPFGTAAQYRLVKPLQTGCKFNSEVWVAELAGTSDSDSERPDPLAVSIVFKFINPSRGDIPNRFLNEHGVFVDEGRRFEFLSDNVKGEAASYASLADFQGNGLPYFYGVHEVKMPWGEPAWLLVFEMIPGPPGSLATLNYLLSEHKETKYHDVELYIRLYQSALDTLQSAHKRDVVHADIRESNILIDEAHDQAVLIDWTSYHGRSPESRLAQGMEEAQSLYLNLMPTEIDPHCAELWGLGKLLNHGQTWPLDEANA